MPANMVH